MDESEIEKLERLAQSARLKVVYAAAEVIEAEAALDLKKNSLKAAGADLMSIVSELKMTALDRN